MENQNFFKKNKKVAKQKKRKETKQEILLSARLYQKFWSVSNETLQKVYTVD